MSEWTLERIAHVADPLKRGLLLVAKLTEALGPKGIRPIVVGGLAVEFYTVGGYLTADIDLIASPSDEIAAVMQAFGFEKQGKDWIHPSLPFFVEFPRGPLAGSADRVLEVEVDQGMMCYVIGLEDIILDRVAAAAHWQDRSSAEWAVRLMVAYYDRIDWPYSHREAARRECLETFQRLQGKAKKLRA